MWRPYALTGDHNIVHKCRGLIPLNSKLVNTLSILGEASNLDTSSYLRHLAAKMHIAFLSNPASGQLNVQMATATKLVSEGCRVTFLSADSCAKKIDQLRAGVQPFHQGLIDFIGLGTSHNVSDYTNFFKDRMHLLRSPPGDPSSLELCIDAALGPVEDFAETAKMVADKLNILNPDMICVDALTPSLITGVRLTKRKYILTIPCSPGTSALPGAFEPHMMASNREGSLGTFVQNVYLNFREYYYSVTQPDCVAKREILSRRFNLRSYGVTQDTALLPPHWEDENCVAGIHFNTLGLLDCPKQSSKIVFVGAGVSVETSSTHCPEVAWMDDALLHGDDVIYMNMGSMFIWQEHEFWNCISGFEAAYKERGGRVRFLFKINFPIDSPERKFPTHELPSYIRLTNWIDNQHAIYSHPALKVFIHHGGGNSFNEAVYFGVPQLVLSQWLDTHEYANYAEKFKLGLRSARPPHVEAKDIELKILKMLGPMWPEYKANCQLWAIRSQISGGTASAAKIIIAHAECTRIQSSILTPPFTPVETPIMEKENDPLKELVICS